MFENRVLRGIFGAKRDEVTGEWIKLHNEEFYGMFSLLYIIRVVKQNTMEGGWACSTRWKKSVGAGGATDGT